jgi:hypothetical protein
MRDCRVAGPWVELSAEVATVSKPTGLMALAFDKMQASQPCDVPVIWLG